MNFSEVRMVLAIVVAIAGYGGIVALILLEYRLRKREVAQVVARIRARGCKRISLDG